MNNLYLDLKEYINKIPLKENILDKTKTEYLKEYTRMYTNNNTPEQQATRKSTYYKYRAAWLYSNTLLANIKINEIESEKDNNIMDCLINSLAKIVDRIKRYDRCIAFKKDASQTNLSKKGQVITLKKSWSTHIFNHMLSVDSKYLLAACVCYCSGCRPSELLNGVKIENCGGGLKITIQGTKTHKDKKYGQETRVFNVSIDDPHCKYLKQQIDKEMLVKIDSAKLLSEQLRSFGKKVLQEKTYISAYTYRHNFSRMLKGSGLSRDDIAMCLGHCNDKSQCYYAHSSSKDNNGFKISEIKATKKIKHVVNNDYIKSSTTTAPAM